MWSTIIVLSLSSRITGWILSFQFCCVDRVFIEGFQDAFFLCTHALQWNAMNAPIQWTFLLYFLLPMFSPVSTQLVSFYRNTKKMPTYIDFFKFFVMKWAGLFIFVVRQLRCIKPCSITIILREFVTWGRSCMVILPFSSLPALSTLHLLSLSLPSCIIWCNRGSYWKRWLRFLFTQTEQTTRNITVTTTYHTTVVTILHFVILIG